MARQWLADHPEDRPGSRGKVRKSNRTDNESAKLATDKGVIQGYCGVAVVDDKHQVIVEASAHGTGTEQELLLPVLDACAAQRTATTLITADAGYHSEANLEALAERGIDALIADNAMRRRDERFAERFELYLCGVELANGFGELTDPAEQRRRFEHEMDEKQRIYGERYPVDEDFLAALAHMPPASGVALGFDRLVMLATHAGRIDRVMWTPIQEYDDDE